MDDERRQAKRFALWFPLELQSGTGEPYLAVTRDISWTGALLLSASALEVGAEVRVALEPPGSDSRRELTGKIVRVEQNEDDPDGLWRYRVAVAFDEPAPDLEALLDRVSRVSVPPPT